MGKSRKCPVCSGSLEPRESPISFWDGAGVCRQCGAALRFPLGTTGTILHTALMFVLADAVFLATRQLPDPWNLVAFLLVFTIAGVGVVALVQFYRWECSDPVPRVEKRPEA